MINKPELTLAEVKQSFSHWRFNRRGNESIPDDLWEQVKILLLTYSRGEIMRHLGLTTQQFRERGLISSVQDNTIEIAPTFVQIPSIHPVSIKNPVESILTIQRGDTQINLNHPTNEQIQLVINALLR